MDWEELKDVVEEDLKANIFWWLGRRLKVRIHLGMFLLQSLQGMTDRQLEEGVRSNAVYQVFCGKTVVESWHCPDHTKVEEFRNRLQPETQRQLVNQVLKLAVASGYAKPSRMDVDSTVQEANIAYPSDARLLVKLAEKTTQILEGLKERGVKVVEGLRVDLKAIKGKAKTYFFLAKNAKLEKKRQVFKELYEVTQSAVSSVLQTLRGLPKKVADSLKWNVKRTLQQVQEQAASYLEAVAHFIETHHLKPGKPLAFHAQAVTCIRKGKVGKENEFGAVAVGQRADLLLVPQNPLDNIGNIDHLDGVMLRGRWLPREELERLMATLGEK